MQATPLARLGAPTPDEAGYVDVCETIEIGGDRVTVLRQEPDGAGVKTRTATIVLRGATQNHLDDLERALDDGVASLKALLKDPRLVPGAGATELALARQVDTYGAGLRGLAQHAVRRFATALEVIPRTLAENAHGGAEGNEIVARLLAKHEKDDGKSWGVDVEVSRVWSTSALSRSLILCNFFSRPKRTARWMLPSAISLTRWQPNPGPFTWLLKRPSQFSA